MSGGCFDRAFLDRMYRYCCSLTNDEDAAYDLLQDGLERFLCADRSHVDSPSGFLSRIIRNRFIDMLRAAGKRPFDDPADLDPDCVAIGFASIEQMAITDQSLERIWSALDASQRELLHLWAVEGMTAREVAEHIGAPQGTVLSRIHRLRQRLAALRDDEDPVVHLKVGRR